METVYTEGKLVIALIISTSGGFQLKKNQFDELTTFDSNLLQMWQMLVLTCSKKGWSWYVFVSVKKLENIYINEKIRRCNKQKENAKKKGLFSVA